MKKISWLCEQVLKKIYYNRAHREQLRSYCRKYNSSHKRVTSIVVSTIVLTGKC